MKCHSVQKKLSAYQDNELETHEREQVANHLLSCWSCREQYAEFERLWRALRELEGIRPDPWFYRQLVRKIREPREKGLLPTLQHVLQLFRAPVIVSSIILIVGLLTGTYLGSILTRHDLLPSQNDPLINSQGTFFSSLKVFDPAPSGTLAHGYLQMVSYKEDESR